MKEKTTVLLVGHGSRKSAGNDEIRLFSTILQRYLSAYRVELCFLEFADVLLNDGLDMAAKHTNRVVVVPLMLGAAAHVNVDIPRYIAQAKHQYPDVNFVITKHLGAGGKILQALMFQLQKLLQPLASIETVGIILIGRGSSNTKANNNLEKIGRFLYESGEFNRVDHAFSGLCTPKLETAVQAQLNDGIKHIVVLPYYLFTGILIERITLQVQKYQLQYPTVIFSLAQYMGLSEPMYALVKKRVLDSETNKR